jgi:hypothetical protein
MKLFAFVFAVVCAALVFPTTAVAQLEPKPISPEERTFFESKVRPILVRRCYECHSNQGQHEGGLFLDSRVGWSEGGVSGSAIVPGIPDESLVIQAVRYDGLEMPPSGRLPADEVAVLEQWVKLGAPDPRVGKDAPAVRKGIDLEAGRKHWSFQPLQHAAVPTVQDAAWPRGDVDRFLLADLEREKLTPAPDADRYALLRRATFDLIGLPPTVAEIEAFVADESPQAFEHVVDRLLASRHFGERWGRHWLDVARFAEADGHFFHEAWRYRDYVVDAFNRDLPFDRFVVEQIAGDLLPAATAADRDRQVIATGFLALGPNYFPKTETGVYMDVIDEQIDALTRSMLGLTVACARCHDHKFDPIPTADYYALAGILLSSEIRKTAFYAKGKHTYLGTTVGTPLAGYDPAAIERWQELIEQSYRDGHAVVHLGWTINGLSKEKATASMEGRAAIEAKIATLKREIADREAVGATARQALRSLPPLPPTAMSIAEKSPTNVRIHRRGEPDNLGAEVPRGVIRIATAGPTPAVPGDSSGRLELAHWIADPNNPLTARVAVNRIWLHLFVEGIVRTVDDFGTMGERPSHPELLDYLARKFVTEGWSHKRLIRELILSRAYGLNTTRNMAGDEKDADNRLFWHRQRRRLETEAIRDAILAFSGELDLVPPKRSLIGDHGPGSLRFDAEKIHFDSFQRSLYLPQPRSKLPPLYQLFDHVDMALVTGRRDVTTVPSQALFMLNSDFVRGRAEAAARRLLQEMRLDETARIERAILSAYGRRATAGDLAAARSFLRDATTAGLASAQAWTSLCQVLIAAPEFIYVH